MVCYLAHKSGVCVFLAYHHNKKIVVKNYILPFEHCESASLKSFNRVGSSAVVDDF
jgi:hypothetical protein